MGKEVAKKDANTAVATYDYGNQAGVGFEGTTNDEMSIPFLTILQSNSPQVEDESPEGSKAGMLYNTVTRDLTDGNVGVKFLPVFREKAHVEWIPRDQGGGFVGMHDSRGEVVLGAIKANDGNRFGKIPYGDHELIETFYVYGLLLDEAGENADGFAVVSFTSTKIKQYKPWFTAMRQFRGKPPIFAFRAVLETQKEKNDKGTFYNFDISPLGGKGWEGSMIAPDSDLFQQAVDFREMVASGMARADFDSERAAGDDGVVEGSDGDTPF